MDLEGSWRGLWGVLEGSCVDHGGSWGILGASWGILEEFWRVFVRILGGFWEALADLGGILEGS